MDWGDKGGQIGGTRGGIQGGIWGLFCCFGPNALPNKVSMMTHLNPGHKFVQSGPGPGLGPGPG